MYLCTTLHILLYYSVIIYAYHCLCTTLHIFLYYTVIIYTYHYFSLIQISSPSPGDATTAVSPAATVGGVTPTSTSAAVSEGQPRDGKLSPSNEGRHVSFEEDGGAPGEEAPPKKMTARERWYWAFDKIVAQLNVSSVVVI